MRSRPAGGFTLLELLVAIFVLGIAVAGAVAVVYAAGRTSTFARERATAAGLARTALAEATYRVEHGDFSGLDEISSNDELGPAGWQTPKDRYRASGGVTDHTWGWLWRAHSYQEAVGAAVGLYSVDVWVFRNPSEPSVAWGYAADTPAKRRQTLFYLRSKVEVRK